MSLHAKLTTIHVDIRLTQITDVRVSCYNQTCYLLSHGEFSTMWSSTCIKYMFGSCDFSLWCNITLHYNLIFFLSILTIFWIIVLCGAHGRAQNTSRLLPLWWLGLVAGFLGSPLRGILVFNLDQTVVVPFSTWSRTSSCYTKPALPVLSTSFPHSFLPPSTNASARSIRLSYHFFKFRQPWNPSPLTLLDLLVEI